MADDFIRHAPADKKIVVLQNGTFEVPVKMPVNADDMIVVSSVFGHE